MTKEFQGFPIVGEGKEFYVCKSSEDGILYKIPKEHRSWAIPELSTVDYHEKMYKILKKSGFSVLLPEKFEKKNVAGLGEVIAVTDLSDGGKNVIIALEELDDVDNQKVQKILKDRNVRPGQVAKKRQELRELLLGKGSEGLMDELDVMNIVIGADSFHIVVSEDGAVEICLDDFGTVVVRNDLDYQKMSRQNFNCAITLLSKLSTLSWIIENKL